MSDATQDDGFGCGGVGMMTLKSVHLTRCRMLRKMMGWGVVGWG